MGYRDVVLRAVQRAAEVIDDTAAMERIEQDGYLALLERSSANDCVF